MSESTLGDMTSVGCQPMAHLVHRLGFWPGQVITRDTGIALEQLVSERKGTVMLPRHPTSFTIVMRLVQMHREDYTENKDKA